MVAVSTSVSRPRSGKLHLLAALLILVLIAYAPAVFAHASLISSTPASGEHFSSAPSDLRLHFNEPVSPLALNIVHPDGEVAALTSPQTIANGLHVALPPLSHHGSYAVSWRVVSADGHPVGGSIPFSVGTDAAPTPAHATAPSLGRDVLIWLLRGAWYTGLFMGIGMAVYHAITPLGRRARRIGLSALILGLVATPLSVGVLGVDALDLPLSGLFSPSAWATAWATTFGTAATLAWVSLGCATLIWQVSSLTARRGIAMIALILVGAALASSGHASAAPPLWLARPSVWLHGVATLLWIGALLPLLYTINEESGPVLLKWFSRVIPWVLLVLLASGGGLIYLQVDHFSALWRTEYGRILTAKLIFVITLLALGAYNRYRLTRPVLLSDARSKHAMRRTLCIELIVALAIFALVALWRFTPPPRALFGQLPSADIVAYAHTPKAQAELRVQLVSGRPAQMTVRLLDVNGTLLGAQEVGIQLSNRLAGVEPIAFVAESIDGEWRVPTMVLPHQTTWQVQIDALVSDFERISLPATLNVPEP